MNSRVLVFLQLYENLFQQVFLKETGEHYRQVALNLLDNSTCSQYMDKVSHASISLSNVNHRHWFPTVSACFMVKHILTPHFLVGGLLSCIQLERIATHCCHCFRCTRN